MDTRDWLVWIWDEIHAHGYFSELATMRLMDMDLDLVLVIQTCFVVILTFSSEFSVSLGRMNDAARIFQTSYMPRQREKMLQLLEH
jgi:hypothetical protein